MDEIEIEVDLEEQDVTPEMYDDFLKGEKGDKGDKGDPGTPNTLTIGTVEKGENPDASITGTSPNQVLNLVLPKGDKGDKGDTGENGADGQDGQDGYTPVKGVDYFTAADIAGIESDILAEVDLSNYYNKTETDTLLSTKQATLVSGTNIKSINNTSLLGSGNINIAGNEVAIGSSSAVTEDTKIWVDTDDETDAYSEVVNSLSGNEIAKAPSVRAVNEALETETIRSNAGLVLKKCGNVVNFYTTKYIAQGTLEGYTIPSEYAPKNVIQVPCMAYYSNTLWTPRHIGNVGSNTQKFQIEIPDGHADTSYVYAAFNLVWFI